MYWAYHSYHGCSLHQETQYSGLTIYKMCAITEQLNYPTEWRKLGWRIWQGFQRWDVYGGWGKPYWGRCHLEAYSTDFVAGDTVGKLMAFILQIRASSEVTWVYLCELCQSNNCPTWEIKLWIHTRWGSLSDCFRVVLGVQCICAFVHFPILLLIFICRLSIYSVFSLMKMKTSHPWRTAKIGATLSLLEWNGSLSSWLTTA